MASITDTFARPRLLDTAPSAVVDHVAEVLGAQITLEQPAVAGFTHSVASLVSAEDGRALFVKAGLHNEAGGDAVRTGGELAEAIGDLGPALLSAAELDGWVVAIYERLPGAAVEQWMPEDLPQLAKLSFELRERLDPSPLSETETYAKAFAPLLGTWEALANPDTTEAPTVTHVRDLELPYGLDVGFLAALEADWFAVLGSGNALQHGDIRRDNVMREPSGRLRLVDWTHRWIAPGWADWVRLVPDVATDEFDAESVFQQSAWAHADEHGVNVMLAGLAGRCWRDGHLDPVPGLPQLRPMQLLQGDATLRWLANRTS